jgi:hypothetical protein
MESAWHVPSAYHPCAIVFQRRGIVFHDIAMLLHFKVFHCLESSPATLFVLLFLRCALHCCNRGCGCWASETVKCTAGGMITMDHTTDWMLRVHGRRRRDVPSAYVIVFQRRGIVFHDIAYTT